MAACAATDTWLHDADGAPLLVVTSEMKNELARLRLSQDDSRLTYWLCDQPRVRVGRLRPRRKRRGPTREPEYLWLRQITVLRADGRQTVVVTNRNEARGSPKGLSPVRR